MPFARLCSAALLALSFCAPAPAPAAAPRPPIEHFFANAAFSGAVLSPDGRALAARSSAPGQRDYLLVVDLQTNSGKVVASYSNADIRRFQWVNSERLLFDVHDKTAGSGNAVDGPGLFAVNRDGTQLVQLAERDVRAAASRQAGRKLLPRQTFMLDQPGAQDSEFVYVETHIAKNGYSNGRVGLLRLNTLTGQAQDVTRPAADVHDWLLDHAGKPRLARGSEGDTTTIHYLDPAKEQWRVLASFKSYGNNPDEIKPLRFGPDGTLYVSARNNRDTLAVHTFDFKTGKINPEPLLSTGGYDFEGEILASRDKVLGMAFTTDATSVEWFDAGMKAIQASIDTLLPATVNLVAPPPRHAQAPWLMVQAYSDRIPPTFYLYNTQTKALNKIGSSRPLIDPKQMGSQQAVRYKARDGLEIPALLTLPPGGQRNVPMVVLVHGGPWVRGSSWGWNPQTQFLASRGYAVLEPEFRGSTGFGAAHYKAGFKQWGLAMQDDVADGVRWAIDKGIAAPQRVCIAGASYGGYATLMGLVNDPDLYRCGINWVGVTDIDLMYSSASFTNDMPAEWKRYGMPEIIGDRVKDAAQLKATSPIAQAGRIKRPLLLAYGGADRRVPIDHGTKFHAAVKRTNAQVEWVEYPEEGHGFRLPKNSIDFWTRVEKFLDKHIGQGAVQQ
ncbi:MAG: S9 family peptidase [Telluria sp.]